MNDEQTEWRSGEVKVWESSFRSIPSWVVDVPWEWDAYIPKSLFPEAQFLADTINGLRPKPRFTADQRPISAERAGWQVWDGYRWLATFSNRQAAVDHAQALNDGEVQ